jgi:dihydroxyacetone kinase
MAVCKILGAGSEQDMGFQDLVALGRATSTHMASVCAALDHCHVPGRTGDWQIPEGRMEIGLGLHNETVSRPAEDRRSEAFSSGRLLFSSHLSEGKEYRISMLIS